MVKGKAMNGISRVLVLAMLLIAALTCGAAAQNVGSMQQLVSQIDANDKNIVLTADIQVTQTITVGGSKDVKIDLNGHKLTRGGNLGTMFLVSGGKLTIVDSKSVSVSQQAITATPARDPKPGQAGRNASDGTGIALPSSLRNGELTYYKSVSTVNADGITTTETRYQVTADVGSMGGVLSGNTSNAALIRVEGGDSVLTVEGGAYNNPNGRIIEASDGAELNLTGGYFYGSTIRSGRGGAVYVRGSDNGRVTAYIGGVQGREVVFAGNSASDGGALATEGSCALNIHDGAVFSGNKATGTGTNGGGAIYIGSNTNAVMDGGLVTNNWGTADFVSATATSSYNAVGGGMLIRGTLLLMGGQVTHNEAAGGGGLSTVPGSGGVLSMTGGIVAGNVARLNEGGGITIASSGSGSVSGGYITNNATETDQHWGGGGMFISDGSALRMLSVVITKNHAGGFGGGLAGCSTGRIDTHALNIEEHSVALYGNSALGTNLSGSTSSKSEDHVYAANDPVFMREGDYFQDYFCALNTTVCTSMLGGGVANWTGTIDGRPITPADLSPNQRITSQYITGLTSDPSDEDIAKGIAKGAVFVTGNSSGTHGGGILCNGYLIVGLQKEITIGDRMTIKGDKTVSGGTVSDEFAFIVTDANGAQITTGESRGDSEIVFAGRIPFDNPGTYTYWIYEKDENIPANVKMDQTRYRMVVTVSQTTQQTTVPLEDDPTQRETVTVRFNKISSVEVYKCADASDQTGTRVARYTNISSENRNAYALPYTFEFVNRVSKDTGFVVSKTVHDPSGQSGNVSFRFTVTLSDRTISGQKGDMTFTNGVASFTLKGGESLRAINLPANIQYSVVESPADGYHIENGTRTGTTVQDVVQSVVFENTAVGSLKIKKTVADEGATSLDKTRLFTFSIRLTNGNNISGPYGDVIFENGVAYVELRHGEEITIPNLPAGTTYEIIEENPTGFDQNALVQDGTVFVGQTSTAHFINTRRTGELHIKKTVVDSDYNGEKFEFVIELINAEHISGTYGDVTFVGGKATVYLGNGDMVKATGLPTGVGYTVDERFSDDYSGHYAVGVVGDSSGIIGDTPAIVSYTNVKFAGLEIRKDVSGTITDRSKEFTFEITLSNDKETLGNSYGGLTFVDGKATFTLKDGEYLVLSGLPDGTRYSVRETNVNPDIYNVQINDVPAAGMNYTVSGVLSSGDSAAADFHNFRRAGSLELTKTTSSPVERDSERTFEFVVTVSEPINAQLGDFRFVNGVAHVYLMHGQTAKAINLPAGLTYTIVETADADFDSAVSSGTASGTIAADQTSSVTFHNTRRVGGLKIRKTVDGDADANDVFGFKITLDRELNGTFGDVTFVSGVGTFELKSGETVEIEDLPEHTVYTIIETTFNAQKYLPVVNPVQGDIDYNDTVEVDFVNEALEYGGLTVKKTITGEGADMTKKFTFRVTLSDTGVRGEYGEMTFVDGVATFELGHEESISADYLPAGVSYKVEELDYEDYVVTQSGDEGVIADGQMIEAVFNNHRARIEIPQTGDESPLLLYGALMAAACALFMILRRRANRE